jgi:alpha-beta hydrolase superfamily lysophospholipase
MDLLKATAEADNVLVELVRISAADGAILDAALARPHPDRRPGPVTPPFDAVCLIHGTGGNFYSSTFFELLTERFLERGSAVLRANTRGHDGISTLVTAKGPVRQGAAFEIVDDCRHDLEGLAASLRRQAGPRIAVLGHSLGAVKSLYAIAHGVNVDAVIALSPPRLSYSWFCQSARADEFLETYRRAEALMAEGKPGALIEVRMPLPMHITAAGYCEKYGPDERYNYLNLLHAVRCPALVLFGGKEVIDNVAFQQAPEEVARWQAKRSHLEVDVIPGGDHFYTGVRDAAWQRIDRWLTERGFVQRGQKGPERIPRL